MTIQHLLSDQQRLDFITDCELADSPPRQCAYAPRSLDVRSEPLPQVPSAVIVGGSIIGFTEGVSQQNKGDLQDSFLFARLAANKQFDPETQGEQWYRQFNQVLATLGWLSTNRQYARHQASETRFTMDQVGLEIIASAIAAASLPGPASAAMLKVAADALKALRNKEQPLKLFENHARSHQGGNFSIGTSRQSEDGTLNVVMGAVNFRAQRSVTNVLFWEWGSAEVDIYRGEDSLVLNASLYERLRQKVKDRLGANAEKALEEYEI